MAILFDTGALERLRRGRTILEPGWWIAVNAIEEAIPLVFIDGDFIAIPEVDLHLIWKRVLHFGPRFTGAWAEGPIHASPGQRPG